MSQVLRYDYACRLKRVPETLPRPTLWLSRNPPCTSKLGSLTRNGDLGDCPYGSLRANRNGYKPKSVPMTNADINRYRGAVAGME